MMLAVSLEEHQFCYYYMYYYKTDDLNKEMGERFYYQIIEQLSTSIISDV